jgi:hypothetical protein
MIQARAEFGKRGRKGNTYFASKDPYPGAITVGKNYIGYVPLMSRGHNTYIKINYLNLKSYVIYLRKR